MVGSSGIWHLRTRAGGGKLLLLAQLRKFEDILFAVRGRLSYEFMEFTAPADATAEQCLTLRNLGATQSLEEPAPCPIDHQ